MRGTCACTTSTRARSSGCVRLHYHSAAIQGAVSCVASERESPAVAVTWPSSHSLPVRVRLTARRASAIWRALCLLSDGVFQPTHSAVH